MKSIAALIGISGLAMALAVWPPQVHGPVPSQTLAERDVVDDRGRTVWTRTESPRRVVALTHALPIYLTLEGTAQHIVGISRTGRMFIRGGLLERIFPAIATLSEVDTPINPEQIMLWEPDLVLSPSGPTADALLQTGMPGVIQLEVSTKTLEADVLRQWLLIGTLTGQSERAVALVDEYRDSKSAMTIAASRVGKKVLALWSFGDAWYAGTSGYYLNALLRDAGAKNVLEHGVFNRIDIEQVFVVEPDILLLTAVGNNVTPDNLFGNPLWQAVRAVRERRVYIMPIHSFYNWPVDIPWMKVWLMQVFGTGIGYADVRQVLHDTIDEVYSYEMTSEEMKDAIRMRENASSAGYSQFEVR